MTQALVKDLEALAFKRPLQHELNTDFGVVVSNEKYQQQVTTTGQDKPNLNSGEVSIELESRPGVYTRVQPILIQAPPEGTRGIVLFIGRNSLPVFIPFVADASMNSRAQSLTNEPPLTPGEVETTSYIATYKPIKTGEGEDFPQTPFVNFQAVIGGNLEWKTICGIPRSATPMSEHWGTPETIQALINMCIGYYNLTNKQSKLIVGDISVEKGGKYSKHVGEGHATGRGADLYAQDGAESVYNIKAYGIEKALKIISMFYDNGARYIIWDVKNVGLENQFLGAFGRDRFQPSSGNHDTHWHVSFLKRRG